MHLSMNILPLLVGTELLSPISSPNLRYVCAEVHFRRPVQSVPTTGSAAFSTLQHKHR